MFKNVACYVTTVASEYGNMPKRGVFPHLVIYWPGALRLASFSLPGSEETTAVLSKSGEKEKRTSG